MPQLTPAGREELALALLLWKDFKSDGQMNIDISIQAIKFATELGVLEEFNALMPKLPPMKVIPR